MANMTISSVNSTSQNRSITISNMGLTDTEFNNALYALQSNNDGLVIYAQDNELILSDHQMITTTSAASAASPVGSNGVGVVAKFSTLYQDYYTQD